MSTTPTNIVTVDKIKRLTSNTPLKAFVSVSINGKLKIHDCRIVQQDGQDAWVSMPQGSYEGQDGKKKYYPIIEVSDALKQAIQDVVLAEWRR